MDPPEIVNHGLSPEDIERGGDLVYRATNQTTYIAPKPTFLTLPSPYREHLEAQCGHNCERIQVLRTGVTPPGFPFGEGRKVYLCEHDLMCVAGVDQFYWFGNITPEVATELGI